jgi:thioredoxin-like negative regulator of GroEL
MFDLSDDFEIQVLAPSYAGVSVAYFTTPTCGPCRMLKPRLEKLESQNESLFVTRIDATLEPELAAEHNIRSVPTLLVYSGGYQVDRIEGIQSEKALQEKFSKYLED